MRVLLSGTTGIEKGKVSEQLTDMARNRLLPQMKTTLGSREWVKAYCLETEMKNELGGGLQPFLDNNDDHAQQNLWNRSFERLHDKLTEDNPHHALISMHLVYHRNGHFFSFCKYGNLARLRISVVVTLIDDVYDQDHRLRASDAEFPKQDFPDWPELLLWRSCEIDRAKHITENLYFNAKEHGGRKPPVVPRALRHRVGPTLPHFIISVKHPPETLYNMLFARRRLPVYCSFPISRTRFHRDSRDEIDSFRGSLHSNFSVLDPLGLDERRIISEIDAGLPIRIRPTQRWPMGLDSMVEGCADLDEKNVAKKKVIPISVL